MLLTIVVLVVLVLLLIGLLEIVNAAYDAFATGHMKAVPEEVGLGALPQALFAMLLAANRTVSLLVHEFAHAAVQGLSFGRPRIVLCSNGGYAQSQPWGGSLLFRIPYFYGHVLLGGIAGLAPLLLGAGVIYLGMRWLAVDGATASAQAEALQASATPAALKTLPGELWTTGTMFLGGLFALSGWKVVLVLVAFMLLMDGLTPSSVDFAHSRHHIPAYALTFIGLAAAIAVIPAKAHWVLMGGGLALLVVFHGTLTEDRAWPMFLGTLGLGLMVSGFLVWRGWLGADPAATVASGLTTLVTMLVLAIALYVLYLGAMLAVSLLTLNLKPMALMFSEVPRAVAEVFQTFDTCEDCSMHFRRACDGCGRTPEQIAAGAPPSQRHQKATAMAKAAVDGIWEAPPEPDAAGLESAVADVFSPAATAEPSVKVDDAVADIWKT